MSASLLVALGTVVTFLLATPARGGGPAVTLQEVDGGQDYYSQFSHPLPSGDSYFPIGVWFESVTSQSDVDKDKDAGLNTYVVLTRSSNLSLIRNNNMHAFPHHGDFSGSAVGSETAAWELEDEIDMMREPGPGCTELKGLVANLPDDGRMSYNNFGKGVAFWESDAQASCYVNAVDLVSDDIYWFTDPGNACSQNEGGELFTNGTRDLTEAECRRASNYGTVVEKVRRLSNHSKPIWGFVEVGHPFTEDDAPTIQPAQVKAAVWHSIIGGARGIIYFNHSFGGPCQTQHALRDSCYANVRATVKDVDTQVKNLAPVLNSPFVTSGWSHGSETKAMVKWDGDHFYVFAGAAQGAATGQFSMPCVGDATATVVGESRDIAVNDGSFSDSFAGGNAIHIYRIDGGSTCGLPGSPAPNTSLGDRPDSPTNLDDASFTYSSNRAGANFECRIDDAAFSGCPVNGQSYSGLADGAHTFEVRAVDAGVADPTPASFSWTIDTAVPDTVLDSHPADPSATAAASFAYHASEASASFQCRLDSGQFAACGAGGKSYSAVSDGAHTFEVRAHDAAGNADASPATYTWTVDTPEPNPPNTTVNGGPGRKTKDKTPTFHFKSDQSGVTFECGVDSGDFRACESPYKTRRLHPGLHHFRVRAISGDGPDSTPAKRHFKIIGKG
jgi:hypothetical protein